MFATLATVHNTLKPTPMQLLFDRGAILNISYQPNWKLIKDQKLKLIKKKRFRRQKSKRSHL